MVSNASPRPDRGWQQAQELDTTRLTTASIVMGARLYIPALGRFTQPDPEIGGSANAYDYADQDPINFDDPTGNDDQSIWSVLLEFAVGVAVVVAATAATSGAFLALAATEGSMALVQTAALGAGIGAAAAAAGNAVGQGFDILVTGTRQGFDPATLGVAAVLGGLGSAGYGFGVRKTFAAGVAAGRRAEVVAQAEIRTNLEAQVTAFVERGAPTVAGYQEAENRILALSRAEMQRHVDNVMSSGRQQLAAPR